MANEGQSGGEMDSKTSGGSLHKLPAASEVRGCGVGRIVKTQDRGSSTDANPNVALRIDGDGVRDTGHSRKRATGLSASKEKPRRSAGHGEGTLHIQRTIAAVSFGMVVDAEHTLPVLYLRIYKVELVVRGIQRHFTAQYLWQHIQRTDIGIDFVRSWRVKVRINAADTKEGVSHPKMAHRPVRDWADGRAIKNDSSSGSCDRIQRVSSTVKRQGRSRRSDRSLAVCRGGLQIRQ